MSTRSTRYRTPARRDYLYNYSTANAPTTAGPATLTNTANTAGILDYAPITGAYKELTSFQIANESAITRGAATPIFYNLKITQNGLLSFAYSVSGARTPTSSRINPSPPRTDRCRRASGSDSQAPTAAPATSTRSCASRRPRRFSRAAPRRVNEKESAKVQAGTQAYFAYYNPNDWTGTVTANNLLDSAGVISVSTTANWDASCVLTGTASGAPASGGGAPRPTSAVRRARPRRPPTA